MSDEMRRLLADAQRLVGQREVSLRVDAANLETVYVGELDDQWLASDRGETFMYLVKERDDAHRPWPSDIARSAVQGLDVEVVGESNEDSAWYRIQAVIGDRAVLSTVVALVADAIDRVFEGHRRADQPAA